MSGSPALRALQLRADAQTLQMTPAMAANVSAGSGSLDELVERTQIGNIPTASARLPWSERSGVLVPRRE